MAHSFTPQVDRWDAKSQRLRGHIESLVVPVARWGDHRNPRSPAIEHELAYGDYLHD